MKKKENNIQKLTEEQKNVLKKNISKAIFKLTKKRGWFYADGEININLINDTIDKL